MKLATSSDSAPVHTPAPAPPALDRQDAAIAVACFLAVVAVLCVRLWRGSLYNGDEAIYAEMAREMRSGSWLDLRYAGKLAFQRPLLYPWLLCLFERLLGESDLALRLPSVLAAGATVAGTYLLGRRLSGRGVGVWAALLLAASHLFVLYGRAVESDVVLLALVTWATYAWIAACAGGRRAFRWTLAFGLLVGAALLVKQVVGLAALVAPVAGWIARRAGGQGFSGQADAGMPAPRALAAAAGLALLVLVPWHLYELAAHGGAFLEGYLGVNVARRASHPIERTPWWFYVVTEWAHEGPLAIGLGGGALVAAARAVRRREAADVLLALWGLGGLLVLSAAATRLDYYALIAYPALAVATARLAGSLPDVRSELRRGVEVLVALGVAYGLGAHTYRLLHWPEYSPETRPLAEEATRAAVADEPLVVFDRYPFAARYYSRLATYEVDLSDAEYQVHAARYADDLPGGSFLVSPDRAPDFLRSLPRYLGIAPRASFPRLAPLIGQAYLVHALPEFVLFSSAPGSTP